MPIPVPISAHNLLLPPDELTDVRLNFEWRRLVVELLWQLQAESFWSGAQVDIEDAVDKASAMLEDIYTVSSEFAMVNYAGALVQRASLLAFDNLGTDVPFETESPAPLHDVGGFFDVGLPTILTIPTGLDGYYWIFAEVQLRSGAVQAFLEINDAGLGRIAGVRTPQAGFVTLAASVTRLVAAGDRFSVIIKTDTGTRDIVNTIPVPGSARFGLYRVGLVP